MTVRPLDHPIVPRPECVGGTQAQWDVYWRERDAYYGCKALGAGADSTSYQSVVTLRKVYTIEERNARYNEFASRPPLLVI